MAEPASLGMSLVVVDREFDPSRLEKQFLSRAFDLILGVVRKARKIEKHPRAGRLQQPASDALTSQGARP